VTAQPPLAAQIVADFSRQSFRIALIPPDNAVVIVDLAWKAMGRREPRIPPPHLMALFDQNASAIGRWLEQDPEFNILEAVDPLEAEAEASRERFDREGWATEAFAAGWRAEELHAKPPDWSRLDAAGVAFLIGDNKIVEITSDFIQIETPLGSRLKFHRAGREHLP
jgi:hypothetical protein